MLKWIDRIIHWNRNRKLRNAISDIRVESAQGGLNIDIVENGEVGENDIVLNGPDGARIIVSGLEGNNNIKEIMGGYK
jgi:hypothetical protein